MVSSLLASASRRRWRHVRRQAAGRSLERMLVADLPDPLARHADRAANAVLHEVIHAIFAVATVQVEQGEEHVVSSLATYLAQIIRDNPEFVRCYRRP
jgi:hypothetical protein